MKPLFVRVAVFLSFAGLLLVILGPLLFAGGWVSLDAQKHLLLAGTLLWFLTVPAWMKSS